MPVDPSAKATYNKNYYRRKRAQRRQDTKEERTRNLSLRLPESLIGRLHRLVNEAHALGKYPWRTLSEAVKTLVIDGLRSRKGADDTVDEMMPHLEYMEQINRIHVLRREAQGGLARAREEIHELLSIGAVDQATQYFHVTMDSAQKMPPTAWRDWMIEKLNETFPQLASTPAKGVSLMAHPTTKVTTKGARTHVSTRTAVRTARAPLAQVATFPRRR